MAGSTNSDISYLTMSTDPSEQPSGPNVAIPAGKPKTSTERKEIMSLTLEMVQTSIGYELVRSAEVDFDLLVLKIHGTNPKQIVIAPEALGLPKTIFRTHNGEPQKERTIRAIYCKAIWFHGGFPGLGSNIRGDMPSVGQLTAAFPAFTYPGKEATWEEILDAIKKLSTLVFQRKNILPNAQYFVAVLDAMVTLWPRLRDSGKRRAYYFMEVIAKVVRFDGVDCKDITKFTTYKGVKYFSKKEILINAIMKMGSWKGLVDGHSRGITEVKANEELVSVKGSDSSSDSGGYLAASDEYHRILNDVGVWAKNTFVDRFFTAYAIGVCHLYKDDGCKLGELEQKVRDQTTYEQSVRDENSRVLSEASAKVLEANKIAQDWFNEASILKETLAKVVAENDEFKTHKCPITYSRLSAEVTYCNCPLCLLWRIVKGLFTTIISFVLWPFF